MITLTLDEQLQAKQEGWKIQGGYVGRAYNHQGNCPFLHINEIVSFLSFKAAESDLHRRVYMALPWGTADDSRARREGWCVWHGEVVTTAQHMFATNEDAQAYVQAGIDRNDPFYIKAISTVAKYKLIHGVA